MSTSRALPPGGLLERRLTLRAFSPSDPPRIDARADFALEHRLSGEPLFGLGRPDGACWTLTAGPGKWDRPLACGGFEPMGHGRYAAWLFASDLRPRGWLAVRAAFEAMRIQTKARRVELSVRCGPEAQRACRFAVALGLRLEGRMKGYGPDGADYWLYAGVF